MGYNDLDLNLIKTFLCVYETKNILLASKKLFISQPAVTKNIHKLEEFLGGKLFIRTPKGVIPTIEGESFNSACYNSMKILDNGIKSFQSLANIESGTLNIGSSSTIIRKILMPFIEKFNKKYPNVIITITDANSQKLTTYLERGSIDIAIVNMPVDVSKFIETPILATHDCFIASANFKKDFLTNDELKQQKLILQKRPSSNRDNFELMCQKNNISLSPSFEIGSFGLITDFVAQNMGIASTIYEFVESDIKSGRVKKINTQFNFTPRNISALKLKTSTNSFVCDRFIKELKDFYKKDI